MKKQDNKFKNKFDDRLEKLDHHLKKIVKMIVDHDALNSSVVDTTATQLMTVD